MARDGVRHGIVTYCFDTVTGIHHRHERFDIHQIGFLGTGHWAQGVSKVDSWHDTAFRFQGATTDPSIWHSHTL